MGRSLLGRSCPDTAESKGLIKESCFKMRYNNELVVWSFGTSCASSKANYRHDHEGIAMAQLSIVLAIFSAWMILVFQICFSARLTLSSDCPDSAHHHNPSKRTIDTPYRLPMSVTQNGFLLTRLAEPLFGDYACSGERCINKH